MLQKKNSNNAMNDLLTVYVVLYDDISINVILLIVKNAISLKFSTLNSFSNDIVLSHQFVIFSSTLKSRQTLVIHTLVST